MTAPTPEPGRAAMAGHTPGPWRPGDVGWGDIYGSDGVSICYLHDLQDAPRVVLNLTGHALPSEEVAMANARLIAAAPDLLAALDEMLAAFEYDGATEGEMLACHNARAALAKARGA